MLPGWASPTVNSLLSILTWMIAANIAMSVISLWLLFRIQAERWEIPGTLIDV